MIVKSEKIYFEDGPKGGYLVIEKGKFAGYLTDAGSAEYTDFGTNRVIPGIIDTHNHGTCGYGLMGVEGQNEQREQIKGYLKGCASQAITGVFPTVGPDMIHAVAEVAKTNAEGAEILGIHSEGPWLNRTGENGIRTGWPEVSMDTAARMMADGQGRLRLVALAAEIPGIDPIIEYFLSQGVTVALAHSDCNYEQAMAAYAKGLSVATHTGNVMTGLHHRDVGGLGAALLNDDVMCEVICDGMHISLNMLKIYFRVKDTSRFIMISDCTNFSGAPAGKYKGWDSSMTINVTPEGFVLSDTGRLCGSSQPVLYGIKNLVEKLHMPLETVLQMSSLNACRKYGLEKAKGSISFGKDADFAVIDDDYQALATFVNGRQVYDGAKGGTVFNPEFYEQMKK